MDTNKEDVLEVVVLARALMHRVEKLEKDENFPSMPSDLVNNKKAAVLLERYAVYVAAVKEARLELKGIKYRLEKERNEG